MSSETTADDIARAVAEFVLNHETHILDGVGDFGLLLGYLEAIKASNES